MSQLLDNPAGHGRLAVGPEVRPRRAAVPTTQRSAQRTVQDLTPTCVELPEAERVPYLRTARARHLLSGGEHRPDRLGVPAERAQPAAHRGTGRPSRAAIRPRIFPAACRPGTVKDHVTIASSTLRPSSAGFAAVSCWLSVASSSYAEDSFSPANQSGEPRSITERSTLTLNAARCSDRGITQDRGRCGLSADSCSSPGRR